MADSYLGSLDPVATVVPKPYFDFFSAGQKGCFEVSDLLTLVEKELHKEQT